MEILNNFHVVDCTTICFLNANIQIGGAPDAPTNLVTSEVTYQSFRATWTAPEGPVEKYRVEYMTESGAPQQVILPTHYNTPHNVSADYSAFV